jgi:hypothetical protein
MRKHPGPLGELMKHGLMCYLTGPGYVPVTIC